MLSWKIQDKHFVEQRLEHWCRFDHLTTEAGIALLTGADPVDYCLDSIRNHIQYQFHPYGPKSLDEALALGIPMLDSFAICTVSLHEDIPALEISDARKRFAELRDEIEMLTEYWRSGTHPKTTPLSYFVEWARKKNIHIEWEGIARENGLIGPQEKSVQELRQELDEANTQIVELKNMLTKIAAESKQRCEEAQQPSRLMEIAIEVQRQFWSTFDKDAPGAKAPTQNEIVAWAINEYSLTEIAAKAVEKVACPTDRDRSKKK